MFFSIVLNAGSGHGDPEQVADTLRERLDAARHPYALHVVRRGEAPDAALAEAVRAAHAHSGALIAVGGDGTLNAVANAAWRDDLAFGALPQGTFNYFGRELGLPLELDAALDGLLAAVPTAIDVGLLNGNVFLVNASLGLYPRLLENRETAKRRFGRFRLVAFASALLTLLRDGGSMALELDTGEGPRTLRTRTLFVGNNALQLRELNLPEASAVANGQLGAIALHALPRTSMLRVLWRGIRGRLSEDESVETFAFTRMRVRPLRVGRPVKVAMDGEVSRIGAPLEFRVAERPLRMLLPPESMRAATDEAT